MAPGPVPYAEIKYGASTAQGHPAGAAGIPVGKMTDMVDNYAVKLGTPITLPMVGSAKPTHHIFYTSAP